jgi:hypothetical protein
VNGPRCDYARLFPEEADICFGFPVLDLHHAFIKKSAWRNREFPDHIHHPYNCVLICRAHHDLHGQTEELRKLLWKLQAGRFTYDELVRWMQLCPGKSVDRFWLTNGYWTPMLN